MRFYNGTKLQVIGEDLAVKKFIRSVIDENPGRVLVLDPDYPHYLHKLPKTGVYIVVPKGTWGSAYIGAWANTTAFVEDAGEGKLTVTLRGMFFEGEVKAVV